MRVSGGRLPVPRNLRKSLRKIGFLAALWLVLGVLPLALGVFPLALGWGGAFAQQLPSGPGSVPKLRHGPNGEVEPVPDSGSDSSADSGPGSSPPSPNQPRQTAPSQAAPPKKAAAPAKSPPVAATVPPPAATAPSQTPAPIAPLPQKQIMQAAPQQPPAEAPDKSATPAPAPAAPPAAVSSPAQHFVAPIAKSDLAVDLVDFIKVPPSSAQPPLAAINSLISVNDGSGRLFVNDMRGKIYVIRDGRLLEAPFLDSG